MTRAKPLVIAIAVLGTLCAIGIATGSIDKSPLLPIASAILVLTLIAASAISVFVWAVIALMGGAHAVLLALTLGDQFGWLQGPLAGLAPTLSMPVATALFSVLLFFVGRLPAIEGITRIADPYFEAREPGVFRIPLLGQFQLPERWIGLGLFFIVIAIELCQVAISVRLSYFNRDWFNAIQNKNEPEFWRLLLIVWLPWVVVLVVSNIYQYGLQSMLEIRWRRWLTEHYMARWLGGATHYRMQLLGGTADNPDQRIAEDVRKFTVTTFGLTMGLLRQVSTLVSFSVILWSISADFTVPGTDIAIPGMMFWFALIYAILGTVITHMIGRPLIRLNFMQERYEADFRYGLARLREYGEQIALLRGETAERERLSGRFAMVIENFYAMVSWTKRLTAMTSIYFQSTAIVPYIIAAPFYFAGKIQLGVMSQTAGAFARVEGALSYFISAYQTLADYKAVVDRLTTFDQAIDRAGVLGTVEPRIEIKERVSASIVIDGLRLSLPNGDTIVDVDSLALKPGTSVLLTGPSGSGKSTLFRALAGIWPYGSGRIDLPQGASVMLLPQRPYIPIGTLREALTYPLAHAVYPDDAIRAALVDARLGAFADRLSEEGFWAQTLSLGEQQRLAIARALLTKPRWLYLDEATASLDEPMEAAVYAMLAEKLPDTTVISIGHRSTLVAMHDRVLEMRPNAKGRFTPTDKMLVPGE